MSESSVIESHFLSVRRWAGGVVCSTTSETALKISKTIGIHSVKYLFRVLDLGEFGVSYGNHMFGSPSRPRSVGCFSGINFVLLCCLRLQDSLGAKTTVSFLSIISTVPITSSRIRFTLPVSILPNSSHSFSAPLLQHSVSIRSFNDVVSRERLFCQIRHRNYRSKEVFCSTKAKLGLISAFSRATEYQLAGKTPAGLQGET